jgi:hypothetical protein
MNIDIAHSPVRRFLWGFRSMWRTIYGAGVFGKKEKAKGHTEGEISSSGCALSPVGTDAAAESDPGLDRAGERAGLSE